MQGEAHRLHVQNEARQAAAFGSRTSSFGFKSADFAPLGKANAWCWEAVNKKARGFSLL